MIQLHPFSSVFMKAVLVVKCTRVKLHNQVFASVLLSEEPGSQMLFLQSLG